VTNLLKSCRNDVRRLGPAGQAVFAVIDDDQIRKDLNARDVVLNRAAWAHRTVRDCVRGRVPALERLVAALRDLLASGTRPS